MGASVSSNTIKSLVDNSINVINTYQQTCLTTDAQQGVIIDVDKCKLGDGSEIDFQNNQYIKLSCITDVTTVNGVKASVDQSIAQTAQVVTQQFSFPSLGLAQNFIEATQKLSTQITNSYYSTCVAEGSKNTIDFKCKDSEINGIIRVKNSQTIVQDCMLKAVTESTAYSDAVSALNQSSVAVQQSTFAYIMLVFVLLLAVGAWFLVSIADNSLVQWLIVGLVLFSVIGSIVYTATSRSRGNYPYTKP
jgi:hypothetical protein